MTDPQPEHLTALLLRFQDGDSSAADDLLPLVHDELHRLAERAMRAAPPGHTLQATALLNEAWMRIEQASGARYASREHFLAVAAKAMRSVFVDRARRRGAEKRGGGRARVELDQVVDLVEERATDLVALDEALAELARAEPDLARIVELRFFGGLKHPEIARLMEVPLRRVERGWSTARAWLYARLTPGDPSESGDSA